MAQQLLMWNMMNDLPKVEIPEGWEIRNYRPGEEMKWFEICQNGLLGGGDESDCAKVWQSTMINHHVVPEKDTFFVCRNGGEPEATITKYVWPHNGIECLHMVAAAPSIRGNGVGQIMAAFALDKLKDEITHNPPVTNLTTDDWRLPAIVGYLKCGFRPINSDDDMVERWTKVCNTLNIHGIDMLDGDGNKTGIVL